MVLLGKLTIHLKIRFHLINFYFSIFRGPFAYHKLDEKKDKNNPSGTYLLRQCGKEYNTFFIDMIISDRNLPDTFKITQFRNKWYLHENSNDPSEFDNLIDLAKSINTNGTNKLRIPPLEYDKAPLLLLCLPSDQLKAKKAIDDLDPMRDMMPRIIDASKELQFYKDSMKRTKDGILTQFRADWKLPDDKKIEVTVKVLNQNKMQFLSEILKLTHVWSQLNAREIIKLYGVSLYNPTAMVLESTKYGPFDDFLRKRSSEIETVMLIDAAYSLAKALHYLQENNIIHSKIRCSSLHVHKFIPSSTLVVKLGDPGFEAEYTTEE